MAKGTRATPIRWGRLLRGMLWAAMFVSTAVAARHVQRLVLADPRFILHGEFAGSQDTPDFSIQGMVRTSRERVVQEFAPDFGRNIFEIPIAERRRRLLAIDWVEDASVSRLWPNRIVVRIRERKPVAFVNLALPGNRSRGSRLALIDAHGVVLEQPDKSDFSFPVLTGVSEQQSEAERRDRVRHMLRLLADLGPLGEDLSEVDVSATDNLQVTLESGGRAVELMLGNRNFQKRLKDFLDNYPEIRKKSPQSTVFDLRLDDRITAKD